MQLKVYIDRRSQPSRAVLIFCKIDFEEIKVDLSKRQHKSPELEEINPLTKVPAIVGGRFKLFESHAILIYFACAFPGVPDHCYVCFEYCTWTCLRLPLNPEAAAEAEKLLAFSLSKIESIWFKGSGKFSLGGFQPSIADLSMVCEIMQLELVNEEDRVRILGPHKKVQQWIENTRNATMPHFDDVHKILKKAKAKLSEQQAVGVEGNSGTGTKMILPSKI